MKRQTILAMAAFLILLAACSPTPELNTMLTAVRNNSADPNGTHTGSWTVVGTAAAASGTATQICLAVDNTGNPIIAFAPTSIGAKVLKYSNAAWTDLSSANLAITMSIATMSLAVDTSTQYIAYKENTMSQHCKRFAGASWSDTPYPFSNLAVISGNLSLVFDNGIPYVAFRTATDGYVGRYDPTGWINSTTFGSGATAPVGISLAVSSGTPYVSFSNPAAMTMNAASVKSTNFLTWSPLMNGAYDEISSFPVSDTSIVMVGTIPYVAYLTTSGITVKKYASTSTWSAVGAANFISSTGNPANIKLAVKKSSGQLYLAFKDATNRITVMKFDGTNWVNVGLPSFSGTVGSYLAFAVSQSDGVLYVAYDNLDNTNQAQVMKFN